MALNYQPVAPTTRPIALRFCLVAFGGGVAGFVMWCALDFVLLRFAPAHIRSFDWVELLFPFAVGFVGAAVLRQPDSSPRVGLAIVAAIVASVVAVVLILVLGIPFHFAIGGKL